MGGKGDGGREGERKGGGKGKGKAGDGKGREGEGEGRWVGAPHMTCLHDAPVSKLFSLVT